MKDQIKKDWVTALRSDKFEQATGHLCLVGNAQEVVDGLADKKEFSYCCLGVLYEITGDDWLEGHDSWAIPFTNDEYNEEIDTYDDSNEGELPERVLNAVGLSNDEQQQLIQLNDGINYSNRVSALSVKGMSREEAENMDRSTIDSEFVKGHEPKSFHEIADFIEKNL